MHPRLRHPLRFRRDHAFAAEHASAYLDGELDAAGRERVEGHARFCPRCQALLASLRRVLAELRRLGDEASRDDGEVAAGVIAHLRLDG
jgi:anti-sigma factor RsiW